MGRLQRALWDWAYLLCSRWTAYNDVAIQLNTAASDSMHQKKVSPNTINIPKVRIQRFLNATGWSQLAPLWPDCHIMCRLHEPKCSHVLRLFLALTCMVHGCGGSSSRWRGIPSWCFSSQHFNSGDFHWWALDVGCHARKWNTERKQALSKESNSFWFYFNLSNSLLLV